MSNTALIGIFVVLALLAATLVSTLAITRHEERAAKRRRRIEHRHDGGATA